MGTVKWFSAVKGYVSSNLRMQELTSSGTSARSKAGYTNLAQGARVSYEMKESRSGKIGAENLGIG
nr:cold shock domain-containing protein [Bradyrhizobium sp. CCBAU 65884]